MAVSPTLRSGKGHRDENFPVASRLIHPRHRAAIQAFYEFVRTADDIADHAQLGEAEKITRLDRLEQGLLGANDESREAVRLRIALAEKGLSPHHAQDLLKAFRLDASKRRYRDWNDLIDYCRYSAMPVGRFVLDVHGESRETWAASDPLCAALQIINHLQDCGKDYRDLDRVYIPLDALAAQGVPVEALGGSAASPQLRACLRDLTMRTQTLLAESRRLSNAVRDTRLAMEIAVIHDLAERIVKVLLVRDPLSERVHLGKVQVAATALFASAKALTSRGFVSKRMPREPRPT
jgi:squalene synthase HpnC